MGGGYHLIAEEAYRLAKLLPDSLIEAVAARIEKSDCFDLATLRGQIAQTVPGPHHRALVTSFLDRWRAMAADVLPQSVAIALITAMTAERQHQQGQSVELVWTGPKADVGPIRRTEQVILQVLDSAQHRIFLVSYAVYNIPRIADAVVRAAGRGVRITIIVEAPDPKEVQAAYNTLRALGDEVAACSTVYLWPRDRRPVDDVGRHGILHVKCAEGDGRWLFLSSANLTEYAFTLNMELGILVTGGDLPAQVETYFGRLIQHGVVTRAETQ
jgi:phosphatidylserine/phosphatidylglycerophosphate/cardiolipin synthase-like enzyme